MEPTGRADARPVGAIREQILRRSRISPSARAFARSDGCIRATGSALSFPGIGGSALARALPSSSSVVHAPRAGGLPLHSHSIVPGGFDVMSYTTRLTPLTSLMIRIAVSPKNSMSNEWKSGVMPSPREKPTTSTHQRRILACGPRSSGFSVAALRRSVCAKPASLYNSGNPRTFASA
jgi:hypothetical protein